MPGLTNKERAILALRRIEQSARDFGWLASLPRVREHDNAVMYQITEILSAVKKLEKEIFEGRLLWRSRK